MPYPPREYMQGKSFYEANQQQQRRSKFCALDFALRRILPLAIRRTEYRAQSVVLSFGTSYAYEVAILLIRHSGRKGMLRSERGTTMILEGWAAYVSFGDGMTTDWADHTWVSSPQNGQYFECWGGHSGPSPRKIVVGNGSYNWANCYRCPIWPFRDTAGTGIYAIDGVCHQSANCFLYTANVTLNFNVRGYWFSLFSYGTFGRSYLSVAGNAIWLVYVVDTAGNRGASRRGQT